MRAPRNTTITPDEQLVGRHIRDLRRRSLEESTIYERTRLLRRFTKSLDCDLLEATPDAIHWFLDTSKISRRSRYTYIAHLHAFYTWAVDNDLIERAPTERVARPKVRPGLPRPISDADLGTALDSATGPELVIITLGAFQGMRCLEISRLGRDDVLDERDPPLIVAHGKGDKPRILPLHTSTEKALINLPMPSHGPVLQNRGRPWPAWKVSAVGGDFLRRHGVDATMHQLRHWFATSVYQSSGRDLLLLQDLLGHASIKTTTVYAAYDRKGAAEAVRALHVGEGRDPTMIESGALRGVPGAGMHLPATGHPTRVVSLQ